MPKPLVGMPAIHWHGEDGLIHEITYQGKYLKWKVLQPPSAGFKPPKRGNVKEFSKASRLRMLSAIAQLDWQAAKPCLFITLTYPDETNVRENYKCTQHRSVFWRYLETFTGHHVPGLWRIEWKQRKSGDRKGEFMPHFHIIAFKEKYLPHEMVKELWQKAIGVEKAIVQVKAMTNERQAGYYVAKYAAKVTDCSLVNAAYLNSIPNGRQWGILRKSDIPFCKKHGARLAPCDDSDVARMYAQEGRETFNVHGNESFTLLGEKAVEVGEYIFGTGLDGEIVGSDNA